MQTMTSEQDRTGSDSASGGPTTGGLRVILADDDVLLREGMASLLQRPGFQVVGQAGDAVELLALVRGATRTSW
jgi:hypothetical protein